MATKSSYLPLKLEFMPNSWTTHFLTPQGDHYILDGNRCRLVSRVMNLGNAPSLAFGAPPSAESPYRSGDWVGAVDAGGACNCFVLTLNPHCHGTHTESIGHLTRQREPVWGTGVDRAPVLAQLVTVQAICGTDSTDGYTPAILPDDWIIPVHAFQELELLPHVQGLVIRVAGAPGGSAPFFSHESMRWIVEQGIEHLLVELPSVDRSDDDGLLSNHRIFWNLAPDAREASADSRTRCTITELIELPADLPDGLYGVMIQLPPLSGDALPSTVYLLPAKATSSPLP